jgi:2-oxoglutarate ferredoxin oxidoreductase subunit alpha
MQRRVSSQEQISHVVVRFAGDSGDGMQLTGDRFTSASALFGNDLSTFPDYPAEIRAPAGTVNGVSSFQVHISDHDITTPGDSPNVLMAMNPAALKADLHRLEQNGLLIVNSDAFETRDLEKAGYDHNPLHDDFLSATAGGDPDDVAHAAGHRAAGREGARLRALEELLRARPGVLAVLAAHRADAGMDRRRFKDFVKASNIAAFKAGYNFGETSELFDHPYQVKPAQLPPGEYTNISGNVALAWGLVAAGQLAKLPLFLGSYPITPASDILHELSKHKHFGVRTVQAEDEIAAIGMALGAAFAGHLGITTTSGPGVALKSETISLGISLELPLLIVDIQRGGPSTGLPTKTEAADLNIAMYGRHGEAPLPIVAAYSPAQCFDAAIEAARIALKYRTPVILLSDGLPRQRQRAVAAARRRHVPDISVPFQTEMNHVADDGTPEYWPYLRDPETLARPWAIPGTPGLMHRVGGIEKEDGTGNISYSPANHSKMVHLRAAKVAGIANDIPLATVIGDADADVCLLGWGSTWAAIDAAVQRTRREGTKVAWIHLTHLNPLPPNLGELLRSFKTVLVPELNLGHLCRMVRAEFLIDAKPVNKVQGLPFTSAELEAAITEALS